MAHFRKLPSGNHQAIVTLPGGRQVTKTHPVRKVVEHWATDVERDRNRGLHINPRAGKLRVEQWAGEWLESRAIEDRTLDRYTSLWNIHIKPTWGSKPLGAVTRTGVEGWVRRMVKGGVGVRTVQLSLTVFSSMLTAAVEERLLPANPARGVKAPRSPSKPPRFFDRTSEAPALLEQLSAKDRVFVDLLLHTGLRWGEAAGLRRSSLDFLRGQIHVNGVRTVDGRDKDIPKSKRSRRTIPMPKHLRVELSVAVGERGANDYVFVSPSGGGLDYSNWRERVWKPAVKAAGLVGVTPHTTRHTTASWLVMAGVPLFTVQQILGHETMSTTQIYAHLAPEAFDVVRDVLDPGSPTSNHQGDVRSTSNVSERQ